MFIFPPSSFPCWSQRIGSNSTDYSMILFFPIACLDKLHYFAFKYICGPCLHMLSVTIKMPALVHNVISSLLPPPNVYLNSKWTFEIIPTLLPSGLVEDPYKIDVSLSFKLFSMMPIKTTGHSEIFACYISGYHDSPQATPAILHFLISCLLFYLQ